MLPNIESNYNTLWNRIKREFVFVLRSFLFDDNLGTLDDNNGEVKLA